MKILVVTNMYPDRNPAFNYQGIFVKEQLESLRTRENVQCDLFVIDGFKSKFNYLFGALKVFFKIKFGRYDVIHAHYGLSGLFVLFQPLKTWKNVVVTLHGGDILIKQNNPVQVMLSKLIIKRVGRTVILNQEMENVVHSCGVKPYILPCGSDSVFFDCKYSRDKKNIILFPGSPKRPEKNFPLFEKIVKTYIQIYGDVEVVAVDGYTREEVSTLLSNSKALVMTSFSEGSPQIIKEALLCDLPVISTNVGDVSHVLCGVQGTYVFDIESSDYHAIAKIIHDCIKISIETPGLRRSRVLELGLDQNTVTDKLLELYDSILDV